MSQHVTDRALGPVARACRPMQAHARRGLCQTSALCAPFLPLRPSTLGFSVSLALAADSPSASLAVSETSLVFSFATVKIGQDATPTCSSLMVAIGESSCPVFSFPRANGS